MNSLKHRAAAVATLSFAAITGCAHRAVSSDAPPAPPPVLLAPCDPLPTDKPRNEPQVDLTIHPPCILAPQ